MVKKPSAAMMAALRDFVFRHDIFVEAREFDDGFIFTRQPKWRSKHFSSGRHFEVFLRRDKRRVHFYSLTCGGEDLHQSQVSIDSPEKALVVPTERRSSTKGVAVARSAGRQVFLMIPMRPARSSGTCDRSRGCL